METESLWISVAFCVFVASVFIPSKKAILKALDEKIANAKEDLENSLCIKKEASEELEKAKYELSHIEEQKALIIKQADDRASRLKKSTELKMDDLVKKRAKLDGQSGDYQKKQLLIELKQTMLREALQKVAKNKGFLNAMDAAKQLKNHQKLLEKFTV